MALSVDRWWFFYTGYSGNDFYGVMQLDLAEAKFTNSYGIYFNEEVENVVKVNSSHLIMMVRKNENQREINGKIVVI